MDHLSEAAAVHGRIDYGKNERKDSEKCHHRRCYDCGDPSPDPCHQGTSHNSLEQGKKGSKHFGSRVQELNVKELEIVLHDESCANGIHQFENACGN